MEDRVNKNDLIVNVACDACENEDFLKLIKSASEIDNKEKPQKSIYAITKHIIDDFCDNIEKSVIEGKTVNIRRLITFKLKELSKREVCNNFTSNERTVLDKRMVPKAYISNHIKQEYKKK